MDVALICKALGDSNRLRIVVSLLEGEMCACRLLEAGYSVILVEKRDIPGGSMSMTYGGVATAGSKLQYNYDVDGSFRSSAAFSFSFIDIYFIEVTC